MGITQRPPISVQVKSLPSLNTYSYLDKYSIMAKAKKPAKAPAGDGGAKGKAKRRKPDPRKEGFLRRPRSQQEERERKRLPPRRNKMLDTRTETRCFNNDRLCGYLD